MVALAFSPGLDLALALVRSGSELTSADLVEAVRDLAGVHAVLLMAPVLWTTRPPTRHHGPEMTSSRDSLGARSSET